ncbi:hypothetical protein E2C01_086621 [Portunus trituberculatus]|uniref:Uncharacterized protein n=1 Tax=Portunus trituberculatus TaxID=210409 RepID=A0A5B7JBY9_PORTR|nr:hypothetical protein [Portunus trituberculatus]
MHFPSQRARPDYGYRDMPDQERAHLRSTYRSRLRRCHRWAGGKTRAHVTSWEVTTTLRQASGGGDWADRRCWAGD